MKRIIITLALVLAFSGCAGTPTEEVAIEQDEEVTELEVVSVNEAVQEVEEETTTEVKVDEPRVDEPAEIVEEEPMVKEIPKVELRLVYEPPAPVEGLVPPFVAVALELNASTPEDIIINVLYFDKAGELVYWDKGGGQVYIIIWKGTLTKAERLAARKSGHEGDFQVLGLTKFGLTSSENVIVIPTSALSPYDGDKLTVMFFISKITWRINPPGGWFPGNSERGMAAWSAIIEKNW